MRFLPLSSLILGVFHIAPASGWGNLGHRTIAFLAQKYLSPTGQAYTASLLGTEDISDAAIWADSYKVLPEGKYTNSWHFVDAKDDPPTTCNVVFSRDCIATRTCIIAAIGNMTRALQNSSLTLPDQNFAFKFLLHLIGDLHNPLHAESINRGGNDIKVLWNGGLTNLHFVWDVEFLSRRTNSDSSNEIETAKKWADSLYSPAARVDEFHASSVNVSDPEGQALTWAAEANALNCAYVLKDGVAAINNTEVNGTYYEGAVPIVDDMVSKAGVRLAAWIEALAGGAAVPEMQGENEERVQEEL